MKYLYIVIGFLALILGTIGIPVPILPTVPFYLLAAYCFGKSSEKLHNWFIGTSLYKKHLADFYEKKGMTLKTKWSILLPVSGIMLAGAYFSPGVIPKIIIAILMVIKYYVFFFVIKTLPNTEEIKLTQHNQQD
ncbi:MAG: YbaN family protein [Alcaligenaceae bacterium]|nr:YbaN family protein [Alcaligenaceae bacterium]